MSVPLDKALYARVKAKADEVYSKPSAYKSGYIVRQYKAQGGRYKSISKDKPLKRWYAEKWKSVADKDQYPVYRPSKKISKKTPLLPNEISNLKEQIEEKQKIKGTKNLKPFKKK